MKKLKLGSIVILCFVFLSVLIFFIIGSLKPKVAGIFIETNPQASVYLDGIQVGRTPFKEKYKPGEVVIKLIPDSFQTPLAPFETKVNLVAGVETVIKRDFGEFDETSSGETISFEKIDKNQTNLAVVSIPDSAQLLIDGRDRVYTPHKTSTITAGEHSLIISSSGYEDKIVEVKTHSGYKLTAIVKLAKSTKQDQVNQQPLVSQEPEKEKSQKVRILSTPTGFLRVRSEPSSLGEEVGKVDPGKSYNLISTDEKTGWYKIEYEEEKEGWISNQYAELEKTEDNQITPTPTTTSLPKFTPTVIPNP